jgi:hypothetical protein
LSQVFFVSSITLLTKSWQSPSGYCKKPKYRTGCLVHDLQRLSPQ